MALFFDPPPKRSRAEWIEFYREHLEDVRKRYPQWSLELKRLRHELTLHLFFARVERGDPVAIRRYAWWKEADGFREKLRQAQERIKRTADRIDDYRARITTGADASGRRYAPSTLKNYARALRDEEKWWANATAELRDFLASAPPSFSAWRAAHPVKPAATRKPRALAASRGNVIAFADWRDRHEGRAKADA